MTREKKALLNALVLIVATHIYGQDPIQPPKQEPAAKPETCTLQGTVIAADTGTALKSAWVTLTAVAKKELGEAAADVEGPLEDRAFFENTDATGHFILAHIPAGNYELQAGKTGYLSETYHPHGGPTTTIKLKAAEKADDLQLRLARAAVIIGRITDEVGEPVAGVEVDAFIPAARMRDWIPYDPGRLTVTNDLGEYRIYGLRPGSYYLSASDSGYGDLMSAMRIEIFRRNRHHNHPPTYYPGVTRIGQAQKVRISAGQELHIDFSLQMEKLLTVSGQVLGLDGKPASEAHVELKPRERSPGLILYKDLRIDNSDAAGNFVFREVLPGSYVLTATREAPPTPRRIQEYWAEQQIEVGGDNATGLRLQLNQPLAISGKVTADPGAEIDVSGLLIVMFDAKDDNAITSEYPEKDGTFVIENLCRPTLRLRVSGLPDGWYVRSASFGKQDVLEGGLRLAGLSAIGKNSLKITISPGAARVEGTVRQGADPVPRAMVRLFQEPTGRPQTDMSPEIAMKSAQADEAGHFIIENIVPGKYRALAYLNETDEDGAPPDGAASFFLGERESKTVQFKLPKRHE